MENRNFNPYHCQMDYETNIAEVQYEGDFNKDLAIKYAKESYSNIKGEIVYHELPTESKGFTNLGIIGII